MYIFSRAEGGRQRRNEAERERAGKGEKLDRGEGGGGGEEVHCIPQKSVIIIAVQIGLITAPKRGGKNTTPTLLTFLAQYGIDADAAN